MHHLPYPVGMQPIALRYGKSRVTLNVPDRAVVLTGPHIPALPDPHAAVRRALQKPIGCDALRTIAKRKAPKTVAITISDITRPVPNELLIEAILEELASVGIAQSAVTIIIGTGMHRPSTEEERRIMLGESLPQRLRVIDHRATELGTCTKVCDDPPVSVCTEFLQADLRIVTGLIEPHFMAGFSGGRKGVCPGLVDLNTVQRFHGYHTMSDPNSVEGRLEGNPCHAIAHKVAHIVGVDFLVNVAITHDRKPAGLYCGDLDAAFLAGCKDVASWTCARIDEPFDLVVTCAGGFPLDKNFYQTVKGMCTALPALHDRSKLLMLSACEEIGEPDYVKLYDRFGSNWKAFLNHIETSGVTEKDQWEYQMQTRVLQRIGIEGLLLANDGLPPEVQQRIATTPIPGAGDAVQRAQRFIDGWDHDHPQGSIAVIPEGPYTMIAAPVPAGV